MAEHRISPPLVIEVATADAGQRFDMWLAQHYPDISRARAQQWIRDGYALMNGTPRKARHPVQAGDRIEITPPPLREVHVQPEAIPLDILYEDAGLLVLNKPAGLVVHPAAGHDSGTLVNALLYHCTDLAGIGGEIRPGIVHRLDKDTSGVMVIAKKETTMQTLSRAFKERAVHKRYWALVRGNPQPESGKIDTLIGRDPHNRKRMSARVEQGRTAETTYTTIESFGRAALLNVHIATGRTHQIRVHMAHIGHPILGDHEYGRARTLADGTPVPRQMLHAATLTFPHPEHGEPMEFNAPMPADMRAIIQALRA